MLENGKYFALKDEKPGIRIINSYVDGVPMSQKANGAILKDKVISACFI